MVFYTAIVYGVVEFTAVRRSKRATLAEDPWQIPVNTRYLSQAASSTNTSHYLITT